jgi:hypothetical protein
MSPTTIRFLKVGMAYFLLGALLGTLLAMPFMRGRGDEGERRLLGVA